MYPRFHSCNSPSKHSAWPNWQHLGFQPHVSAVDQRVVRAEESCSAVFVEGLMGAPLPLEATSDSAQIQRYTIALFLRF
jgi:hypothetical protein